MWKKRLQITLWVLLGAGTCTLLVAAMQTKERKTCSAVKINIEGAYDHVFVNDKEITKVLVKNGAEKGKEISEVALSNIELALEKNAWIKKAELFFDNKQVLHVDIEEREPLARVFTLAGTSYYIDSSSKRLPLSNELSAQVPMFTSFPSDKKKLSKPDSLLMEDVKHIAQYIQQDSFLMAQVAQVDITPQKTFEITPVLGDQVIKIGNAEDLDEKFSKLKSFYQQVWAKTGFEKYETIDVQYKNQVVAVKRGSGKVYMDTAAAVKQFANTIKQMQAAMSDTNYAAVMPKPAIIKDTTRQENNKVIEKDAKENKAVTPAKKSVKTATQKKQPKAVLKKH